MILGAVEITGVLIEGETLTASVTGEANGKNLKYIWRRGEILGGIFDLIPGAGELSEYKLTADDVGHYISVTVTQEGHSGILEDITTDKIETAVPPPVLTGTVEINGNLQVGGTLTADLSNLDGAGTPSYQWYRGDGADPAQPVSGAIADIYTLDAADENLYVYLEVSRAGYDGAIRSTGVGPVLA
jgi:hypothetical protein